MTLPNAYGTALSSSIEPVPVSPLPGFDRFREDTYPGDGGWYAEIQLHQGWPVHMGWGATEEIALRRAVAKLSVWMH
ncbi:MAG TPA: hypothetical protein VF637_10335 [Sphingomicrobium sp.]|jgi:hypothetical protein